MMKWRLVGITLVSVLAAAFSSTAIMAQTATETPVPPPVFTDGRINDTVDLGGLAIYCVDKNSNTHVNTFQNGAITVWGIGDQKYINLDANELRGNVEIPQLPPVTPNMTEEANMVTQAAPMMTEESSTTAESTPAVMAETPILLARANTPSGVIGFFSLGGDQFVLQGHDDKGKFFTYTWTGCSTGRIDNTTAPYLPTLEATATEESSAMMTQEATP